LARVPAVRHPSLVEREQQLRALREVFAEPSQAEKVVLLSGEAGFGKTSLLRAALGELDHRHRVLVATCEPIGIPAALSPLFDILDELPDELRHDIESGAGRWPAYTGMLDLIKNDRIVLVIEDVHWADEATLGLARYLGRRIAATDSCLILSFRLEELEVNPPLRLVVADLAPVATTLELQPLSLEGVEKMASDVEVDAKSVHLATLGNPFYVEEVLRNPGELPLTVQTAVLANAGRLPDETLEILRLVALSPDGLSTEFLEELGDGDGTHSDLAFHRRLLASSRGRVSCRHELVRQSLVQALPPRMTQRLHQRLLDALEDRATRSPDIARMAFHSIGAGDRERAMTYSLEAGCDAAKAGAHRQASFHYTNAFDYQDEMDSQQAARFLLEGAIEHALVNAFDEAADFSRRRLDLMGSTTEVAQARAWLAFFESRKNDLEQARAQSESAIAGLRDAPTSEEHALAVSVLAWVELVEGDRVAAVRLGEEGSRLARASDSTSVEVYARTTVGMAKWWSGDVGGLSDIEDAVELGLASDAGEFAARALNASAVISLGRARLVEARESLVRLQDYATTHELDAWFIAAATTLAWVETELGLWGDADLSLSAVVGQKTCVQTEIEALIVAATLGIRRGEPEARPMVDRALERLGGFGDHDARVTTCAMAMEAAWSGIFPLAEGQRRYDEIRTSAALADDRVGQAQLSFWAHRLGWDQPGEHVAKAVGLEIASDSIAAATAWESRGFATRAAIVRAMADGHDVDAEIAGLSALGAHGVTKGIRRELRRHGVTRVPRGANPTTQQNPAGMTQREMEVLDLVVVGMSNAQIGEELYISEKTASHHVSSVLAKLKVARRGEAAALAISNGWSSSFSA
jgi:DNA-binding CsgD family transcriptional regulator